MIKMDQYAKRCLDTAQNYRSLAQESEGEMQADYLILTEQYMDIANTHLEAAQIKAENAVKRDDIIARITSLMVRLNSNSIN